jgi:hypothetical protein
MDKGLATNNGIDATRNNMTNVLILKNVKFMDRQASLNNNAIRLPNYDRSMVEHSVANDPSQAHHKKSLKLFHQNIRGEINIMNYFATYLMIAHIFYVYQNIT